MFSLFLLPSSSRIVKKYTLSIDVWPRSSIRSHWLCIIAPLHYICNIFMKCMECSSYTYKCVTIYHFLFVFLAEYDFPCRWLQSQSNPIKFNIWSWLLYYLHGFMKFLLLKRNTTTKSSSSEFDHSYSKRCIVERVGPPRNIP